MTNSQKLQQSTELLAARGEGMQDGLRWVMRLIKEQNYRIWGYKRTEWDYVCGTNELTASIRARLGAQNGQGTPETQKAKEQR